MNGVYNQYAHVDLSNRRTSTYSIPSEWYLKHLGGRGIGTRILIEEIVRKGGCSDPLGEENVIVFSTGPMQGTGAPGSGKYAVLSWSPKTFTLNESYAGGFFGHVLAMSGYDGLIVTGKSDVPCYVTILNGKISIEPAERLWGLSTGECESALKAIHGDQVRVACIGIAGEKLIRFSCIISDRNRAAGRPGFGAVMGSKMLKAIVVGGTNKPSYARPRDLQTAISEFSQMTRSNPALQDLGTYGTGNDVTQLNLLGVLPTRNFTSGYFERAEAICGKTMAKTILTGRDTCAGCPVRCKRVVKTSFLGSPVLEKYGGPEYETLAAFGSLCLVDNLDAIALANQKCNQYGLDTISTGVLMAFLMEVSERGISWGATIDWGDAEQVIRLIDLIAHREGVGNFLAQGLSSVSQELNAEEFAVHIKGVEVPMHDPRGKKGLAISYATSPRGATHLEAMHDTMLETTEAPTPEIGVTTSSERLSWDGKAEVCKLYEDLFSFVNSVIICSFVSWNQAAAGPFYPFPIIRKIISAITGISLGVQDMMLIGERNYAIRKICSAASGYQRRHDDLPPRLKQALTEGACKGESIPDEQLQKQIDQYYALRGFDTFGPTDETLRRLGCGELAGLIDRPYRKPS